MFDKKIVAKILVLFSQQGHSPYDKRTMHPKREWFLGLLVFLLIVIAGGLESAHVFLQHQNIRADQGAYEGTVIEYSEVLADNVLAVYTKRKDVFFALQENTQPIQVVTPEVSAPTASTSTEIAESTEIEEVTDVASTTDVNVVPGVDILQ